MKPRIRRRDKELEKLCCSFPELGKEVAKLTGECCNLLGKCLCSDKPKPPDKEKPNLRIA